jgi:enterochelin esterase-like enzyme
MKRTSRPKGVLAAAIHYLSAASLLTTAALQSAAAHGPRLLRQTPEEPFTDFLTRLTATADSTSRAATVSAFAARRAATGTPFLTDSTVTLMYCGAATRVSVAGDLNGWKPDTDFMTRVPGTNLFYSVLRADAASRFEYKLVVDETWILDPFNRRQAMGGYGPNSEIWMPEYRPPDEVVPRIGTPAGKIDTLLVHSAKLGRSHPVFVYLPSAYRKGADTLPAMVVTDGGEYLTLGLMHVVLDNLIADRRIPPVIGIFVDPRTDVSQSSTSARMTDYAMSDDYTEFLIDDVLPEVRTRYAITADPARTGIMGASLGGLCAAFTAYSRPDVFGFCAAQSPSFWWKDSAMVRLIDDGPKRPVRFYVDTGTIRDAQEEARAMRAALRRKGYELTYTEVPEGHNWVNWRARIDDILETFLRPDR